MSDALELATRALKHFNEGTTDLAPSQMRIPLSAYTDERQYRAERQAVFFESPIAVALSLEVPRVEISLCYLQDILPDGTREAQAPSWAFIDILGEKKSESNKSNSFCRNHSRCWQTPRSYAGSSKMRVQTSASRVSAVECPEQGIARRIPAH